MKDVAEIIGAYTRALWERCIRLEENQNVPWLCEELKGQVYAYGRVLDKKDSEIEKDLKLSSKEIAKKFNLS